MKPLLLVAALSFIYTYFIEIFTTRQTHTYTYTHRNTETYEPSTKSFVVFGCSGVKGKLSPKINKKKRKEKLTLKIFFKSTLRMNK